MFPSQKSIRQTKTTMSFPSSSFPSSSFPSSAGDSAGDSAGGSAGGSAGDSARGPHAKPYRSLKAPPQELRPHQIAQCRHCSFASATIGELNIHLKAVHPRQALVHPENFCRHGAECSNRVVRPGFTPCWFNHTERDPFSMRGGAPDAEWCQFELVRDSNSKCMNPTCTKDHAHGYGHRMAVLKDQWKARKAAGAAAATATAATATAAAATVAESGSP